VKPRCWRGTSSVRDRKSSRVMAGQQRHQGWRL
jgi:hypothetical protein